jgi:small subunit ribosomal protein S11
MEAMTEQPTVVPTETAPVESAEKADKTKKRKKGKKHVTRGRAFIQATYNNTIVTFTDQQGNALAQSSAGRCGFRGPKKSTPYAAGVIVRDASERVREIGLKDIDVFVRGIGSGRDGAIRALNAQGFNMISIRDLTPIPHNGCRPKKPRRV